ncbi:hypothetical protein [Spiroplasma endosymbiont of 'Nebria riversi']|uniref:hypothetical protein n=1 Tax=Spiroplasma endosymbiont of 'Nebria riversi' TaxID=2792084 RepID=UPI001C0506B3|nr:hypothetical protein [Spiroplasma endosymbiont of 'Nebria riversi']
MKKFLSTLGAITLVGSNVTSLVACNGKSETNKLPQQNNLESLFYDKHNVFYKSAIWNNKLYVSGTKDDEKKFYELDLNDPNKKLNEIKVINDEIWSLLIVNDELYAGTKYDGLYVINLNDPKKQPEKIKGISNWVDSLLVVNDELYVGGNNGLYVIKLNDPKKQPNKNTIIPDNIPYEKIRLETISFYKDNFYIGLQTNYDQSKGKIYKLNIKTNNFSVFKEKDDKDNEFDTIYTSYVVKNKLYFHTRNSWYSTLENGKLYELDLDDSNKKPIEIKSINCAVWSLIAINDKLYVGGSGGLFVIELNDPKKQARKIFSEVINYSITSLIIDKKIMYITAKNGNIWKWLIK